MAGGDLVQRRGFQLDGVSGVAIPAPRRGDQQVPAGFLEQGFEVCRQGLGFLHAQPDMLGIQQCHAAHADLQMHRVGAQPVAPVGVQAIVGGGNRRERAVILPGYAEGQAQRIRQTGLAALDASACQQTFQSRHRGLLAVGGVAPGCQAGDDEVKFTQFRISDFGFRQVRRGNAAREKAKSSYSASLSNPACASSAARTMARALLQVSSHSLSGTESATMPAPACT